MILEFYVPGEPNSGWVHCSYVSEKGRKQFLRAFKEDGRTKYKPIIGKAVDFNIMAIGRGQISAQIDGKLRGARGEKKKKLQFKKKPNSKNLRSSKYSQKVVQSKKLYNRQKEKLQ
jgi:hypothetical protein